MNTNTPKETTEMEVVDPIIVSDETVNQVYEIINECTNLDKEDLPIDSKINDFIDSLEIIEISVQIERVLNCNIPDSEIEEWITIQDIINSFQNHKNNG